MAHIDSAKEALASRIDEYTKLATVDLSETDTRCKIVDSILKDVLGWPESGIRREIRVCETRGFVDYVLSTTHPYYVIEAKKHRIDLEIPDGGGKHYYVVGGVLSENKELLGAMVQARDYAVSKGVSFCCVTNGKEFVLFRSQNSEGLDWVRHKVWVFRDLQDILERFSTFYGLLSFESVSTGRLPSNMPVADAAASSARMFSRLETRPNVLSRTRERNLLYPQLRQVVRRVFEEIRTEEPDSEILRHCYVETPRDSNYERGLGVLLRDQQAVLRDRAVTVSVGRKRADGFQENVEKSIEANNPVPEVLLLLGGVGAGKTTFIHRFRKVLAKDEIDSRCLWAYVNFNLLSGAGEQLLPWVARQILHSLEREYPTLDLDSWDMLKQIYHREYEKLRRGVLAPVWGNDKPRFEEQFSEVILKHCDDTAEHALRVLKTASTRYGRRPFLVFDNADQHDADTQNSVFLVAQKMAQRLDCSCLISLREESYWRNRGFGALSAFHSVSYHVQAPRLAQVLAKRFAYARKLIADGHLLCQGMGDQQLTTEELDGVVALLGKTVLGEDKRFTELAEYLCPGEVRRPLEFLARFMYSGHTNVNSLLRAVRDKRELTIGFHEYLTSIMLCDREYFSESASDILNLFAVDGSGDASHFNRVAILGRVLRDRGGTAGPGHGFTPIRTVIEDCEGIGILPETTSAVIGLFIGRGVLQTDTQIRENLAASEFVRATSAALYYVEHLVFEAAYLETVLYDTPIGNPTSFDRLNRLTKQSEESERQGERLNRLRFRLDRTAVFIDYLIDEYASSMLSTASSGLMDPLAMDLPNKIKTRFDVEKKTIFRQAKEFLG